MSSYKNFTFPLNVYAHILRKDYGDFEYLHYGLFKQDDDQDAKRAQQHATDLLFSHLPPSPCRILEVGIGLGTTLAKLVEAGYDVIGITPDEHQINYAKNRYGENLPVVCQRLEDFTDEQNFDLIIFQESAQYINPIDLFEAASPLLVTDGKIMIMDEFVLQRVENNKESLPYLEYFLRLAERAGFLLETRIDLSQQATPTLDWLLDAVNRHSETLDVELDISLGTQKELEASNKIYRDKYASGKFGYFFLCFKLVSRPIWKIGRILPERAHEMQALFSDVFHRDMSVDHWTWKYGDGRGSAIGVWSATDGKLIAHYGGTSRAILLFGQASSAFQACDLMVSASERGSFSRKGPVFLTTATFLEHELGYGTSHLLGVGFPNERAYRLPMLLGLYTGSLGTIQELIWPSKNLGPSPVWAVREIFLITQKEKDLADACWRNMAANLSNHVVGVRDAAYLTHRYINHPDKQYRIFIVRHRLGLQLAGLFVIRIESPERCELLDVIGPITKIPMLVQHAQRVAKDAGCNELFLWAVDNIIPDFGTCSTIKNLQIIVPGNGWTSGPINKSVTGKWWLTGGDADFH
jgi:SAM-dependent methyltransferase